jgi:hypothetical protein
LLNIATIVAIAKRLHNLFNYNIFDSRLQYLNFTIAIAATSAILVADPVVPTSDLAVSPSLRAGLERATGFILIVIWLQYDPTRHPEERPARLLVVTRGRLQLV